MAATRRSSLRTLVNSRSDSAKASAARSNEPSVISSTPRLSIARPPRSGICACAATSLARPYADSALTRSFSRACAMPELIMHRTSP
jgi:hypothetical protein